MNTLKEILIIMSSWLPMGHNISHLGLKGGHNGEEAGIVNKKKKILQWYQSSNGTNFVQM